MSERDHGYKAVLGLKLRTFFTQMNDAGVGKGMIHTGWNNDDLQELVDSEGEKNRHRGHNVHFVTDGEIDPSTGRLTDASYVATIDRAPHTKVVRIATSRLTTEVKTESEVTGLTDTKIRLWPKYGPRGNL